MSKERMVNVKFLIAANSQLPRLAFEPTMTEQICDAKTNFICNA